MGTMEQPVISKAAERWIRGGFDSSAYFAQAREASAGRARSEVVRRLHALRHNSRLPIGAWLRSELRALAAGNRARR